MIEWFPWIDPRLLPLIALAALVAGGLLLHAVLYAVARRVAAQTADTVDERLVHHTRAPARLLIPLLLVSFVWPALDVTERLPPTGHRLLLIGFIAAGAWFVLGTMNALTDWITTRYRLDVQDNLRAREVQTKALVLRRSATLVVVVVAAALILMQIPGIERVGASLLASAGLAGIAVGLAARPTLTNLLAGLQLALTQPIRIDDVVIVEGEWGRIEEIRNTFVIVRIWDLRRLVLPLTYFIEKPFQNWTRVTADLLGTVMLHVDYRTPVEAVRTELKRILDESKLWDGKVWNLQVTDATEHTLQLRCLMSAPDASVAWDLRCLVRERLVDWLQRAEPQALPRTRAEWLAPPPAEADPGTAQRPTVAPQHSTTDGVTSGVTSGITSGVTSDGISSVDGRS